MTCFTTMASSAILIKPFLLTIYLYVIESIANFLFACFEYLISNRFKHTSKTLLFQISTSSDYIICYLCKAFQFIVSKAK